MIKINEKVLTNEEIVAMLQEETGSGKMKSDIEFCLLENYESSIRTLNEFGEMRWVKKFQATYALVNTYERRDFKTGGTQTVTYYTNIVKDSVRGDRFHTPELNKVVFHNGYLIVRAGQEDLLLFLRLNEQCKTNKWWSKTDARGTQVYQPTRSFLYKEIIHQVEDEKQYQEVYDNLKAQESAMNSSKLSYAQAVTMAAGYGMVDAMHKGEKAVRLFLVGKAKANPEQFNKDLQDSSFEIRAKVNSAFHFGLLKWDSPYIRWGIKMETDNRIVSVPPMRDHVEYFTLWLQTIDKSGTLERLLSLVEKETLRSYGHRFEEEENNDPYKKLLLDIGASSIEEAKALIEAAKKKPTISQAVSSLNESEQTPHKIATNIGKTTIEELEKIGLDDLKTIASFLGIRGMGNCKDKNKILARLEPHTKQVEAVV